MGGPLGSNSGPLNQQVVGGYNQALGQQNQLYGQGQGAAATGSTAGQQALSGATTMTGQFTPGDVQAGQLSATNLDPYKNPFQQGVIDTTMEELNRQQALSMRGVDDASQAGNAFGGDRWQIGRAAMDRDYGRLKRDTLVGLNSQGFQQAQGAAQQDIAGRMQADLANQGMRQNIYGQGQNQFRDLAGMYGQLGVGMSQDAAARTGDLANMGFGWGADLEKRNLAMGGMQQAMIQDIINAAKSQYAGYTGAPAQGLAQVVNALPTAGNSGTQTKTQDPGILGYLGAGINLLGLL